MTDRETLYYYKTGLICLNSILEMPSTPLRHGHKESYKDLNLIAQLVERQTSIHEVGGSSSTRRGIIQI